MIKICNYLLFMALMICSFSVYAQIYEFKGYSPFGIQPVNEEDAARFAFKYMFKDMDADGDLDLFLFGLDEMDTVSTNSDLQNLRYFIEIQENIGDAWTPEFKKREKKFEDFDFASGNSFFLPTIGDLNNDGKQDMVISAYADDLFVQQLRFDIQQSNFEFETHYASDYELPSFYPGSIFLPELLDLDMDGDLDLLLSGGAPYHPVFEEGINVHLYAKNTGTESDPEFLGWYANPYGLEIDTLPAFICGGDLDLDGDIDLLGVVQKDTLQTLIYFENNPGGNGKPSFSSADISNFGLPVTKSSEESFYFPSPVDLDGDGDVDLFLPFNHIDTVYGTGDDYTLDTVFHLFYYENGRCTPQHEYMDEYLCPGDTVFVEGVAYFEAGCWDLEKTAGNGCKSVVHLKIEVLPEIEMEIVQDESVLTAFEADFYTYQWIDCDTGEFVPGATSHQFQPGYSGNFAVNITDEFGCSETSDCIFVDLTGVELVDLSEGLVLSPNPTTGLINIDGISAGKVKSITVYDIQGRQVQMFAGGEMDQIDLSTLRHGVYLLKIMTEENLSIVKQILLVDKITH